MLTNRNGEQIHLPTEHRDLLPRYIGSQRINVALTLFASNTIGSTFLPKWCKQSSVVHVIKLLRL